MFSVVTALVIGMIIFIPKIQKMIEDAKWKKGIYILPTSQYHAFGLDDNTTITQLNFVSVKESEETFLNFLEEYHFILSNNDGDELELEFQKSFQLLMQHESIKLIKEGELYKHYSISFLVEFNTREDRIFNNISIFRSETERESMEIGQLIYEFFDYPKTIRNSISPPTTVTEGTFSFVSSYSVIGVDNFIIDSIMFRSNNATSESVTISNSEMISFTLNGVCNHTSCSFEFYPYFTTTNDFLTYTLKPLTKYIVDDVTYTAAYTYPILYYRILQVEKYFEVATTFTNVLES